MTIAVAMVIGALLLATLLMFPVVGLAVIPLVVLALLAGVGWLVIAATRGPRSLPEHRPPGEDVDRD